VVLDFVVVAIEWARAIDLLVGILATVMSNARRPAPW
jgi:hypothetical protein